MNKLVSCLLIVATLTTACYRVQDSIEPQVNYAVQDRYLQNLSSPFKDLSQSEKNEPWGHEYLIADAFAKKLDLYRAISTFKRAEILMDKDESSRLLEVQYLMMLSYYLGKKYDDVLETFQTSNLSQVDTTFTTYHDLLLILYETYRKTDQTENADYILKILEHSYPDTAKKLTLSSALLDGDIEEIEQISKERPKDKSLVELIKNYELEKKSIGKAKTLNTFLPGAGYLYVGQKQSAITAFLLNSLFIAATVHFFNKKEYAAAAITLSFETGWYFGGIYGAGESAKLYNERIYEQNAYTVLSEQKLFPVLMLNYGF